MPPSDKSETLRSRVTDYVHDAVGGDRVEACVEMILLAAENALLSDEAVDRAMAVLAARGFADEIPTWDNLQAAIRAALTGDEHRG